MYRTYDTIALNSVRNSLEGPTVTDVAAATFATSVLNDDDDQNLPTLPVTVDGETRPVVYYGNDNLLPYHLQDLILANSVTARCQLFNIQTCYGMGLQFDPTPCPEEAAPAQSDPQAAAVGAELRSFLTRNDTAQLFMEQVTDMKYYDFSVLLLCLSRDRSKIVAVRHRDACHVRFEPRGERGVPEYIVVGNFRHGLPQNAERFALLDPSDPLGDLLVRTGREADPLTGQPRTPEQVSREPLTYAVATRMPTVGCAYYPMPYYAAIFADYYYDIYRLIGMAKRHMIQNTSAPRLQVEVHRSYWDNVCDEEHIMDEAERLERKLQERQNITDFLTKPQNAGKTWVTTYDTTPDGQPVSMVRVNNLSQGSTKEGGAWSEDMQEAANSICFAMGVHPNVVGAVPGKSQSNNSGSDKRELFTLKQSLEKATHDILLRPWHAVLHFNGWDRHFHPTIPMVELTTLDRGASFEVAKKG